MMLDIETILTSIAAILKDIAAILGQVGTIPGYIVAIFMLKRKPDPHPPRHHPSPSRKKPRTWPRRE